MIHSVCLGYKSIVTVLKASLAFGVRALLAGVRLHGNFLTHSGLEEGSRDLRVTIPGFDRSRTNPFNNDSVLSHFKKCHAKSSLKIPTQLDWNFHLTQT